MVTAADTAPGRKPRPHVTVRRGTPRFTTLSGAQFDAMLRRLGLWQPTRTARQNEQAIADAVGINPQTLKHFRLGVRPVPRTIVYAIRGAACGVDPADVDADMPIIDTA